MPYPSHLCYLHHSSRQQWVLNPLSEARNQTPSSWILVGFIITAQQWELLYGQFKGKHVEMCNDWEPYLKSSININITINSFSIIFFFFGHPYGMWKFLGQRSNLCHSSSPSHCSDIRSLICCATRELLFREILLI